MKCPRCGALNREHAQWCTQCFLDLRPEPAPPPTAAVEPPDSGDPLLDGAGANFSPPVSPPEQADGGGAASADGTTQVSSDERYRRVGDELEWVCPRCTSWNPVGLPACRVCTTPFGVAVGGPDERAAAPTVNGSLALAASAVLPGMGHALAGRRGAGFVRALTYVLWLTGGLVLFRGALRSGQSIVPALPLLLGALIVWLTSAYDTVVITEERGREVLQPRTFFWLVVGVIGTLMLSFTFSLSQLSPAPADPVGPDVIEITGS